MHTKEPWISDGRLVYKLNESGCNIFAASVQDAHTSEDELIANARRIVACVNACAGLRTEDLEPISGLGFPAQKLIEQRDELLEALKSARKSLGVESDAGDSIIDTIWHTHTVTLFDFLDSTIEKYDA